MSYQPGQILLDKCRIESLVGRGAFAEVYHATHLTLNAPRALKVADFGLAQIPGGPSRRSQLSAPQRGAGLCVNPQNERQGYMKIFVPRKQLTP